MRFDEYRRYDGLGLAELIANKEISEATRRESAIQRAAGLRPLRAAPRTTRNGEFSRLP